jgi:hypothetical protein
LLPLFLLLVSPYPATAVADGCAPGFCGAVVKGVGFERMHDG